LESAKLHDEDSKICEIGIDHRANPFDASSCDEQGEQTARVVCTLPKVAMVSSRAQGNHVDSPSLESLERFRLS
jgi:hypothetical protein